MKEYIIISIFLIITFTAIIADSMYILYDSKSGKIYAEVPNSEWYYFEYKYEAGKYWITKDGGVNVNIGLDRLIISETAENKDLLNNVKINSGRVDDSGDNKYIIDKGAIKIKPNWREKTIGLSNDIK